MSCEVANIPVDRATTTAASTQPPNDNAAPNTSCSPEGQKKRKYEEANPTEKTELYNYYLSSPHLKQRELAEWFKLQYGKPINQSTVSRILKKMKDSSTSPSSAPISEPTPRKRARKYPDALAPRKIIQHTPSTLPAISLPPTPPPRDSTPSKIHSPLFEFYQRYTHEHASASPETVRQALKHEAQRLHAALRPPPPPERIDEQIVDEAWISNWIRMYIRAPPPSPTSFTGVQMPPRGALSSVHHMLSEQTDSDRTSSDQETEPRSPVSAFSSSELEGSSGQEMSPSKPAFMAVPQGTMRTPPQMGETLEKKRKRNMRKLKREIEKREERIQREVMRKNEALRQLEELRKLDAHNP